MTPVESYREEPQFLIPLSGKPEAKVSEEGRTRVHGTVWIQLPNDS